MAQRRLHLKMRTPEGGIEMVPVYGEEHFSGLIGSGFKVVPEAAGGDTPESVIARANSRYRAPKPVRFAGSVRFHTARSRF